MGKNCKNKFFNEHIQIKQNQAFQNLFYGHQRTDLLILSISGAGILIIFKVIEFSKNNHEDIHLLLKVVGIVFVLTIIVNFISQIFSQKSNMHDYSYYQAIIDEHEDAKCRHNTLAELHNKKVGLFNNLSIYLMFLGLVLETTYFICFF